MSPEFPVRPNKESYLTEREPPSGLLPCETGAQFGVTLLHEGSPPPLCGGNPEGIDRTPRFRQPGTPKPLLTAWYASPGFSGESAVFLPDWSRLPFIYLPIYLPVWADCTTLNPHAEINVLFDVHATVNRHDSLNFLQRNGILISFRAIETRLSGQSSLISQPGDGDVSLSSELRLDDVASFAVSISRRTSETFPSVSVHLAVNRRACGEWSTASNKRWNSFNSLWNRVRTQFVKLVKKSLVPNLSGIKFLNQVDR